MILHSCKHCSNKIVSFQVQVGQEQMVFPKAEVLITNLVKKNNEIKTET